MESIGDIEQEDWLWWEYFQTLLTYEMQEANNE